MAASNLASTRPTAVSSCHHEWQLWPSYGHSKRGCDRPFLAGQRPMADRRPARLAFRPQFAPPSPAHRRPRCHGIVRCLRAWCARGGAERRGGSSYDDKSATPLSDALYACRTPCHPARSTQSGDAPNANTDASRDAVTYEGGLRKGSLALPARPP